MNGEYGAEDPMDNEAVFRDADDLSGFDRTQAWESACEQMNQLGIEEGNLQYKESYCMHIEDLEEQTQRLLKDGSLSAQDAKESWSKDEEGYLFYFLRLYRESKFSGMKISGIIRECMVICRCM